MVKKRSIDEDNKALEYAVTELEYIRGQLKIFMDRFENLLTFYLTALGVIISAVAIVITSNLHSLQNMSLALFSAFAWIFSIVIFFRLCITRTIMVLQLAKERKVQEFFLTRSEQFRDITITILNPSVIEDWKKWRRVVFTPQTIFFFYLLAGFTGLIGVVASIFAMNTILELMSQNWASYYPLWYIVLSTLTFMFSLISCHIILRVQQNKAEHYAQDVLSGLAEASTKTARPK